MLMGGGQKYNFVSVSVNEVCRQGLIPAYESLEKPVFSMRIWKNSFSSILFCEESLVS